MTAVTLWKLDEFNKRHRRHPESTPSWRSRQPQVLLMPSVLLALAVYFRPSTLA
jgi:hypothetical protein